MSLTQICLCLRVSIPWNLESFLYMDEFLVSEIAPSDEACSGVLSLKSSWQRGHILCSIFPEPKHMVEHSHTGGGTPVSKELHSEWTNKLEKQ